MSMEDIKKQIIEKEKELKLFDETLKMYANQKEALENELNSLRRVLRENDPKYLGIPNICFSIIDENDHREIEYSKQRKERGFDSSELWNLDSTITEFILPRLKAFRESLCGYPSCLSDIEEWENILDKIIVAFQIYNSPYFMTEDNDLSIWEEGWNLFCEYFTRLWS